MDINCVLEHLYPYEKQDYEASPYKEIKQTYPAWLTQELQHYNSDSILPGMLLRSFVGICAVSIPNFQRFCLLFYHNHPITLGDDFVCCIATIWNMLHG